MVSSDKISVIVPVYNVEKYINKCIDSILGQTHQNLEVILIDDGSGDTSGRICDRYAESDKRVRVYHKRNEGLAAARNDGIRLSSGAYLAFIDSDDYIEPNMLEILYQRMEKEDSDLAICNFIYVDETGVAETEKNRSLPIRDEVISGGEAFEKLADEKYWYYVTAVNRLYRKEILEGIRFPKGKFHEDEFIAHSLLVKCRRISCVEKALYFYVQREKSIMNQAFSLKRLDVVEALCERAGYAKGISKNVAEVSLVLAGNVVVEGYRRLSRGKAGREVLKSGRKRYNKTYFSLFGSGLSMKTRLKGALIVIHPCVYMAVLKLFRKGK